MNQSTRSKVSNILTAQKSSNSFKLTSSDITYLYYNNLVWAIRRKMPGKAETPLAWWAGSTRHPGAGDPAARAAHTAAAQCALVRGAVFHSDGKSQSSSKCGQTRGRHK